MATNCNPGSVCVALATNRGLLERLLRNCLEERMLPGNELHVSRGISRRHSSLSLGWRNAVLLGVAFGGIIVLWFGRASLSDPAATSASGRTRLPALYWTCWCALVMAVAIEFCILLWAPEFLEHIVGLSKASAAAAAAVSGLAMLVGRTAGSGLLRLIATERLFPLALVVTMLGFLIYWELYRPIVGLFLLGLGVALLYPLTLGFAMGAAGTV